MAAYSGHCGPVQAAAVRNQVRHGGYAIALLMWMIAGMSLLVTAVIQFARDDISMAEQRLAEVQSEYIARGVALLALRDLQVDAYLEPQADENISGDGSGIRNDNDAVFQRYSGSRRYQFMGHEAVASVYSSSSFVSLNGASKRELAMLFAEVGGVGEALAAQLADAVIAYRLQEDPVSADMDPFPGFRYREELLAVAGMRRGVYERTRDYVQVYEAGNLFPPKAPLRLRGVFSNEQSADATASTRKPTNAGHGDANRRSDGLISFESIGRERAMQLSGGGVTPVSVDVVLANNNQMSYRVWVADANAQVLRAERIQRYGNGSS